MYSGFVAEVPSWPSEVTLTYCVVGFTENSIFVFFFYGKVCLPLSPGSACPFPSSALSSEMKYLPGMLYYLHP